MRQLNEVAHAMCACSACSRTFDTKRMHISRHHSRLSQLLFMLWLLLLLLSPVSRLGQ